MTRIPSTSRIGNAGLRAVQAQFEDLGWGTEENALHDFGIDLFLLVTDETDLAVGQATAQVKSGESYFSEPVEDGWIYRESDKKHLEYWRSQGVPHFLVMYSPTRQEAYWIEITYANTVDSGKGWKVVVPASNELDTSSLPDLLMAFSTASALIGFEGGTWHPTSAPADDLDTRVRWALLAPRLVAPHENRGFPDEVDAAAGLAMLMLGRFTQYAHFARAQPDVPTLDEAAVHEDPYWRLVGALREWMESGASASLVHLARERLLKRRVPATILAAVALEDQDDPMAAASLLRERLSASTMRRLDRFDRAWVLCHRGRLEVSLGDTDGGVKLLERAERDLLSLRDPLARGVLAAVSGNLWRAKRAWTKGGLADLVQRLDSRLFWWRSVSAASELADHMDDEFETWSGRLELFEQGDSGFYRTPQWLQAYVTGDESPTLGWLANEARRVALGQDQKRWIASLAMARRSGSVKVQSAIAQHVWSVGPIEPLVAECKAVIDLNWTRTTSLTSLNLWTIAPDVLGASAPRATDLCLESLDTPSSRIAELIPQGHSAFREIGAALASLLPYSSKNQHQWAADLVRAKLGGALNALESDIVTRVAGALNLHQINRAIVEDIANTALSAGDPEVGLVATLYQSVEQEPVAQAQLRAHLVDLADRGDRVAILTLSDGPEPLSADEHSRFGEVLDTQLKRTIELARVQTYTLGGPSAGRLRTRLNLDQPAAANWDLILRLLLEPLVSPEDKQDVLVELLDRYDELTPTTLGRLNKVVHGSTAVASSLSPWSQSFFDAVRERFLLRSGLIDPEAVSPSVMTNALSAEPHRQVAASVVLRERGTDPTLTLVVVGQLLRSHRARVSASAMNTLASRLDSFSDDQTSIAELQIREAMRNGGVGIALAFLTGLERSPKPGRGVDLIPKSTFLTSQSARVRRRYRRLTCEI